MTPPSRPVTLLLGALALAGFGIAAYLTTVHYSSVPLACVGSGVTDCAQVTKSAFSVIPGTEVPITVPGMVYFAVSAAIVARSWNRPPTWLLGAHVLLGLAGIATVLYLVYAEVVVIHKICEWCTTVHVIIVISFLVALRRWQHAAGEA